MDDVVVIEDTEEIQSYVFLDLETTGLPHLEHKRTRITEIALVSAQRADILEQSKLTNRCSVTDLLPRVVNKMNICVYPQKMILPRTTEITGLSNENLQEHKPFDVGLYNSLLWFIERLPKPVCLLAQNGNNFDFPILQSEIQKLGKKLPDTVYCADTRYCFKELLKQESTSKASSDDAKPLNENTDSENEMILLAEQAEKYDEIVEVDSDTEVIHVEKKSCATTVKKTNETTPVRRPLQINRTPLRRKSTNSPNTTPVKSDSRLNACKTTGARKRLPFSENISPLTNFRLGSVYEYITGKKLENAHMAENDAFALLQCAVILGDEFVKWTDTNKQLFNSTVNKLW